MRLLHITVATVSLLFFVFASYALAISARESAREIPIVYEVDVVVLGGSSAGVAAAVGAVEEGATVFLAAPRPYLGEDLCGTYRIWVDPNEVAQSGLANKLFNIPLSGIRLSCYETDIPSDSLHPDTEPPSLLCDGRWDSVFTDSVQYNEDVNIIFDLGKEHSIKEVHIITFQNPNNYEVNEVTVSVSNNGELWQQILVISNEDVGSTFVAPPLRLSGNATGEGRYVKFLVRKSATASRLLLGEIEIEGTVVSTPSNPNLPSPPTLMHLKSVLDSELLSAGVDFLFGCYPTDVLRDADGNLAGIAMCNRSGRQAVVAKTIIDATPRATIARIAGVDFQPYPAGPQTFKRIVIGGLMQSGEGMQAEMIPSPILNVCSFYDAIEYTLTVSMQDGSFASFAEAEQVARDLTFDPEQVDESEMLFQVPPDTINGRTSLSGPWPGSQNVNLDVFRPANEDRLYVLGGCADISREAAEEMLRAPIFIDIGARIGQRAALDANALPEPQSVRLSGTIDPNALAGDVREVLRGIRPTQMCLSTVSSEERSLPVLGEYDVVVVGGGTAGAPAGIAAIRQGAHTLVVEYQYGLGGVGTLGLIGSYCYGYPGGFNEEVDQGVASIGGAGVSSSWKPEWKKEWYRRELRQAGADIWFGVLGCGTFVQNDCVKGIVVATPQGRGVVLSKTVVDSTGNSDIAAAGGAECITIGSSHISVQGAGLPPQELGATYTNTDWTYIDDSDVVDSWRALVVAKDRWPRAYDLGKLIDTRERRRIVGDYILSPLDMLNQRTFPDTIALSDGGLYDSHSILSHPYFTIGNWYGGITYIPYRCLLPKGLDGILVAGLGLSAHGDTMGFIRMQRDIQNVGYAAGVAASMAAESGIVVRNIDISELQQHLAAVGNITSDVMTHTDSYPIAIADIEAAVQTLVDANYSGLSILLAQPDQSVPLLRNAYNIATEPNSRLRCAHVLGLLNDATGVQTLIDKVNNYMEFDNERIAKWFPYITWLDSYIIALGYTRDSRALGPLLDKLALLPGQWRFSHYRSVALALEQLGDPAAAEPLADLLCVNGIRGYTFTDINDALSANPSLRELKYSVRELILARVLYRCGDWEGIGESILREYGRDLRGHLARHAQAVLRETSGDMNDDCKVDFGDYSIMAFEWQLHGEDLKADLHKDGTIDIHDLAVLAEVWLEEQPWPPPS